MASLETQIITMITGDADLTTSVGTRVVFGDLNPTSGRPYIELALSEGDAIFTTGDPYMWMPVLGISVYGDTRLAVKDILQELQEVFDKAPATSTSIDEGTLDEFIRDTEYVIEQVEDEPKTFIGQMQYKLVVNRNLQAN